MSKIYKCVCLFAYLLSLTRVWKNTVICCI